MYSKTNMKEYFISNNILFYYFNEVPWNGILLLRLDNFMQIYVRRMKAKPF